MKRKYWTAQSLSSLISMQTGALKPVIEQISEEAEHTKIVKINIDEEPQLAGMFQVMSIPTLVYMRNGSIQGSVSGYHSLGQIKSWIGE